MPGPDAGVGPSGGPTQARRRVGIVASSKGERDGLLLERDRELERIGGCLHRAQQGDGGALVVEGPAGIGKTVLLAAGRDTAERDGFRVLRARGAELEREFAFGVVRQLVEPVVAGASVDERAGLLEGPPGGGALCWAFLAWKAGQLRRRRSPQTRRSRCCTACTGCAPTWRPSAPWRWWSMTPIGLTLRRCAFLPSYCRASRSCMPRCCSELGRPRPERVGSCWPP